MESYDIGARLGKQRLSLGRTIDDIAAQTKIQPHFLEAIESNDFRSFPSLTFTRNFVRMYAVAVELDPQPLLDALPKVDQSTVPLPEAPAKPRARRTKLSSQPSWASATWALAAAVIVSGVYLYHNQGWRITIERRAPLEQDTVKAESIPTPPPAPKQVARKVGPLSTSETLGPGGPLQVVVTAHERTWLSVKVDGKSGYTYIGTLTPNETRTVSAAEQVKIMTGNAGGISISLNGKELDPIGNHGQFRHVRLTAEGQELLSKDGSPLAPASGSSDPF